MPLNFLVNQADKHLYFFKKHRERERERLMMN
uniref:Uncharacterized protein n=1 Tax=Rhizophora mucronata TaxID=61149 RepID=A0A2P2K9E7_RHIMU